MGDKFTKPAPAQMWPQASSSGAGPRGIPANLHERPVKSVPEPASSRPTDSEFYLPDGTGDLKPNPSFLRSHFFREGRLTEEQALFILEKVTNIFAAEPNMVEVKSPVTICGDVHGQYYDLMKLFEVGGSFEENSYLFLGDYVDRGNFGIECLLYLYSLKLWYPGRIILLRGNHECRHLTEYFTFKRECLHKYSPSVYEACLKSFCALPVTALVDGRFFCVHGGISPELILLNDLKSMNRFQEPGSSGLLCDLLWSDPVPNFGHEQEPSTANGGVGLPLGTTFLHNQTRGCSFNFTYEAACQFLERNGLLGIIRGHEAQDAGYTMHRKTPTKKFPSVITIFSAPNYLDAYGNRAAVLKYSNKNITIRQFNSSPHPFWLPNFMDAFTWSLPFVGAKIADMLLAILSICSQEELVEADSDSDGDAGADVKSTPEEIQQRRQQIKNKILAVGRMQRVFQLLREEAENASELMPVDPTAGASAGLSVQGAKITRNIQSFDDARRSDLMNERLPQFDPNTSSSMFPTPSMRMNSRRNSGDAGEMNMEFLIKKTLEDENEEGGTVERLAEKIAQGRRLTGRPAALKRHETA